MYADFRPRGVRAVDPSANITSIVQPCSVWNSGTVDAEATETGSAHWKSASLSAYSERNWLHLETLLPIPIQVLL